MKFACIFFFVFFTGCAQVQLKEIEDAIPYCPDDMLFAERDLHTGGKFDPENEIYRQENKTLCRGI